MRRTRKEMRKEITESANKIRSNSYLEMLLKIAEIFRKVTDDKEYKELTDLQWKQNIVIRNILDMEEADEVDRISSFIYGMRQSGERRGKR